MAHSRGTAQDRVDTNTMKINNRNMVGSGFIDHGPQIPFAGRLVMQPSTVQGSESIEWGGYPTGGAPQAYPRAPGYNTVPAHQSTHTPQQIMRQQTQQQQQRRPVPHPVQPPRPAPIQQPAQHNQDTAPKLSKSQKAKLRKAKREGKV